MGKATAATPTPRALHPVERGDPARCHEATGSHQLRSELCPPAPVQTHSGRKALKTRARARTHTPLRYLPAEREAKGLPFRPQPRALGFIARNQGIRQPHAPRAGESERGGKTETPLAPRERSPGTRAAERGEDEAPRRRREEALSPNPTLFCRLGGEREEERRARGGGGETAPAAAPPQPPAAHARRQEPSCKFSKGAGSPAAAAAPAATRP